MLAWIELGPPGMPTEQLGRLLEELQQDLRQAPPLDQGARERLADLHAQIERMLAEEGDGAAERRSAGDSVRRFVDDFEHSHPTLTITLGRIMDALNKMGI